MTDLVMLSHIEILQDCSRGNDTILQMFHTESLQILRFEVLQQLFAGGSFRKDPVVQFKGKELASEVAFNMPRLPRSNRTSFGPKLLSSLSM